MNGRSGVVRAGIQSATASGSGRTPSEWMIGALLAAILPSGSAHTDHGDYEIAVTAYLDLATLYRNLIKEKPATPNHFYRSYSTQELDRIMTARPAPKAGVRAREMNLYRRYFDLVATGRKTIEVRVQYPNLRTLTVGDHIRFVCGRDDALTRVKRVARYASFEEMLDTEGPANVNPDSPRDQQLANIRRIYGPEKEALGVLAIEIELLDPPANP